MPVSKKPRGKAASKTAPNAAALPDRRMMESFLAALSGRVGDDATAKAQDVMYDAWERNTARSRIALARKALGISPLCADAYVLLAEEAAESIEEAREYFARGVEAGELALGPEGFEHYAGHFWGFLETRPYMRARAGLAGTLLQLGETGAAIGHFRDMLRLNPNDNQGLRYTLLACLLRQDDEDAVNDLLAAYADEGSAFWLYTRVLVAFRAGGKADKDMAALIEDAFSANEHVPAILAGAKAPVVSDSDYIRVGGPDEATYYVSECGPVWHRTPGAVEWLAAATTSTKPKRKVPRATR